MSRSTLQRRIDHVVEASRQGWYLRLAAVGAPTGAVLATAAADGRWWPLGLIVVPLLSLVTASRPDTHTALAVISLVMWRWLATVDRLDTPWLPVAAICLLIYHSVLALSASVPVEGELPNAIIGRWIRRTAVTGGVTVGMWGLVVVLERRNAEGNALLTAMALALVAGAAVAIRTVGVEHHRPRPSRRIR